MSKTFKDKYKRQYKNGTINYEALPVKVKKQFKRVNESSRNFKHSKSVLIEKEIDNK